MVAHAIAPPHRTRSHFDAQNILESGGKRTFTRDDGWLNRAFSAMGENRADLGLAIAGSGLLTMRGPAKVAGWAPRRVVLTPETLSERVSAMYSADPVLAQAFAEGLNAHALASVNAGSDGRMGGARGGAIGAMAGAVIGGLLGAAMEGFVTGSEGIEYLVELGNCEIVAVVQPKGGDPLKSGDSVQLIYGHHISVVPAEAHGNVRRKDVPEPSKFWSRKETEA